MLETRNGPARADRLRAGEQVRTLDGGFVAVRDVQRKPLPSGTELITLPAVSLGTNRPLVLLPGQFVMIESARALSLWGIPSILVPASGLRGTRGAVAAPSAAPIYAVRLTFENEELVLANDGARLYCPARPGRETCCGDARGTGETSGAAGRHAAQRPGPAFGFADLTHAAH